MRTTPALMQGWQTHNIMGNYAFRAPNEAYPHAKRAAMEALRLDDRLAEAHTALAAVSLARPRTPGSRRYASSSAPLP